jgi:hypothetical protein
MMNRKWVILVILVLLLAACGTLSERESEVEEASFAVGDTPTLVVDNFAGDVTVRAGESGTIRVVATKWAGREKDLDRIEVRMDERDGEVEVITDPPSGWKNVSVDLEITAPAGTRAELRSGAGDVIVRDLEGDVRADSGAGDVDIRGASGEIDAHTGAGSIDYEGRPQGSCRFETGAGSIKLRVPDDVNVEVDLDTGVGSVDVSLPVDGQVSKDRVRGTIGSGDEGEIRARTGAGSIDLIGR